MRGVLRSYEVQEPVTSPTFVIEKIYTPPQSPFKKIVHVDAYRLKDSSELEDLGFKELLKNEGTLILIEWPEHVRAVVPDYARWLHFSFGQDAERFVTYDD